MKRDPIASALTRMDCRISALTRRHSNVSSAMRRRIARRPAAISTRSIASGTSSGIWKEADPLPFGPPHLQWSFNKKSRRRVVADRRTAPGQPPDQRARIRLRRHHRDHRHPHRCRPHARRAGNGRPLSLNFPARGVDVPSLQAPSGMRTTCILSSRAFCWIGSARGSLLSTIAE